jgi:hypothetical protein
MSSARQNVLLKVTISEKNIIFRLTKVFHGWNRLPSSWTRTLKNWNQSSNLLKKETTEPSSNLLKKETTECS